MLVEGARLVSMEQYVGCRRCCRAGQSFRVWGVASHPELEAGAEANADHMLSSEDEEGPEVGEEAQMVSC